MYLTEVGEGEPLVEDEVVQGGLLPLLAASVAYAAGSAGCEATGTDSGSSSKACSTRGAATHLPSRWLAASKMSSALFWWAFPMGKLQSNNCMVKVYGLGLGYRGGRGVRIG